MSVFTWRTVKKLPEKVGRADDIFLSLGEKEGCSGGGMGNLFPHHFTGLMKLKSPAERDAIVVKCFRFRIFAAWSTPKVSALIAGHSGANR